MFLRLFTLSHSVSWWMITSNLALSLPQPLLVYLIKYVTSKLRTNDEPLPLLEVCCALIGFVYHLD
jgi:hypothetical protein